MATLIAAAAGVSPYGVGRFTPLSPWPKSRVGGRGVAAAVAKGFLLPDSKSSSNRPLLSLFQDAPQTDGASDPVGRTAGTFLGKVLTPFAASAAFYVQESASALEEAVNVAQPPDDFNVVLGISAFYAFLYFLVIPAIIYNYLRLRWYKRKAAETFFQFMLVFVFFPGMLLLAPFINFRRLPRDGAEPP